MTILQLGLPNIWNNFTLFFCFKMLFNKVKYSVVFFIQNIGNYKNLQ